MLELPPAPAALVLAGRAFAACAALSAAFRRRMAVLGPPGGVGDEGLDERAPPSDPEAAPVGEVARGEEDCQVGNKKKRQYELIIFHPEGSVTIFFPSKKKAKGSRRK